MLAKPCLDRRIADRKTLAREAAAWMLRSDILKAKAIGHVTTADAGVKLNGMHSVI